MGIAMGRMTMGTIMMTKVKAGLVLLTLLLFLREASAFETQASYYTYSSCIREGTSGIMANGKVLDDEALTCASWDYRFGTRLRITNKLNGRSVVCVVTDRGPAKRLYKRGRKIDVSLKAAQALKMVESGIVAVVVEVI